MNWELSKTFNSDLSYNGIKNGDNLAYEDSNAKEELQSIMTMTPVQLIEDKELSDSAKLVYSLICTFSDDERVSKPTDNQISESLGCSFKNIRISLMELYDTGWIDIAFEKGIRFLKI